MKHRDPHRKHQQLMQELAILGPRIRAFEKHMTKARGKVSQHDWENLVRDLKKLIGKREGIQEQIRKLKDH